MFASCLAILGAALILPPGNASGGPSAARAADFIITGGEYSDGLLIGFNPATRRVTGYFQSETGAGKFSCIFFLAGKTVARESAIMTYFHKTPTDGIKGVLARVSGEKIVVRLAQEHGGCWNVQHFADKDIPAEFDLETAHPWVSIAVIKSSKAYFFDAAAGAAHRKAYVVQGDGVGIRAAQGNRLLVDYVDGSKEVSGWISTSDVYPSAR